MADLNKCVNQAVSKGYITKAAADDIKTFYQNELKAGKAPNAKTAEATLRKMQYDKMRQKQLALQTAERKSKLTDLIQNHPEGIREGLKSLLTKNITTGAGYSNMEYRAMSIDSLARQDLTEAFDALREQWGNAWWTRDKKLGEDVIKEIFGENSGNATAKTFAGQWNKTANDMRTQFNAAGGDIPKLSSWNLPQSHNQFKVGKTNKTDWVNFIKDKLDTKAMNVSNEDDLLEVLDYAYDSIAMGGVNKMEPGKLPKGVTSSLAKSGQQHRVLHFKNASSVIEYNTRFGNDDLYTVMSDHIRATANDISALEIMGPNPDSMFKYLKEVVVKEEKMKGTKLKEFDGFADAMYEVSRGKVDSMYNGTTANIAASRYAGGFRSLNVASKLGSAVISSITDLAGLVQTARYNDMPAMKIMASGFKNMVKQDRIKVGAKLGHGMEAWNGTAASRFSEAGDVNSFLDKAADKVLRASGLSLWTEAFRKSFSMEFSSFMADNFGRTFDDLGKNFQKQLGRYGIDQQSWDLIRSSKTIDADGISYLDTKSLQDIKGLDKAQSRELTFKVMEMIKSETDMAVLMPDARVRALTTAGAQKGTVKGEITRTATQFKSFPMAVYMGHLKRAMAQETIGGRMGYFASYFGMATMLGALAVQGKEASKGREPLDMTTGKFWGASITQGGGLGIFGDFVFSDVNRFGGSMTSTLVGPLGSAVEDATKITLGPLHAALDPDKDVGFGRMAKTAVGYIPGNNLWYGRLMFGKLTDEWVMKNIDPSFERKTRARERKRKKEWGNDKWFN